MSRLPRPNLPLLGAARKMREMKLEIEDLQQQVTAYRNILFDIRGAAMEGGQDAATIRQRIIALIRTLP